MGCASSKKVEQPISGGDKTLLQQPRADPTSEVKVEVVCKSCGGNGKDIMGKRCACPVGQALSCPSVPLQVVVLSARGLRNADWVGKSDPYCTLEVSGKPTPQVEGQAESRLATKVVDNNLNPEWNDEIAVGHYCVGDSLTFAVKDNDPLKQDDPLGQVTVASAQFFENGFEGELQLSGDGTGGEAFLKVSIAVLHPKVTVGIVSARGLRNADWVGKSDPYCVCEVPDRADAKLQTNAITDQLAPVWSHSGVLPSYHAGDSLCFIVKDSDPLKSDDLLGKVTLTQDQFLPNGFSGDVQLVDAGEGCEAFLTIEVFVGEKIEEPSDQVAAETGKEAIADPASVVLVQEDFVETKTAPKGLCC